MCHFEPGIHGAAPMSATGFTRVTMESVILNYLIGYAYPLIINKHFDPGGSNSMMYGTTISFVAAVELSTVILQSTVDVVAVGVCAGKEQDGDHRCYRSHLSTPVVDPQPGKNAFYMNALEHLSTSSHLIAVSNPCSSSRVAPGLPHASR